MKLKKKFQLSPRITSWIVVFLVAIPCAYGEVWLKLQGLYPQSFLAQLGLRLLSLAFYVAVVLALNWREWNKALQQFKQSRAKR